MTSLSCADWHFGLGHLDPFEGPTEEDGQRHSRIELPVPTGCSLMHCQSRPVPPPSFRTRPVHNPRIDERVSV